MSPDALIYVAGVVNREWGLTGYDIVRVAGLPARPWLVAAYVRASDGAEFIVVADERGGRYGYADGHTIDAFAVAFDMMIGGPIR